MGMGIAGGFAAGAGADALQEVLKRKLTEQYQAKQLELAQQKFGLEQQQYQSGENDKAESRKILQGQLDRQSKADELAADARDEGRFNTELQALPVGSVLEPPAVARFKRYNMGALLKDETKLPEHEPGFVGPDIPQPTGNAIYGGTQQDADKKAARDAANAQIPNIVIGRDGTPQQIGTVPKNAHVTNAPAPQQAPLVMVQTVDENGNPVTKIVNKKAGDSYVKPNNATTDTRVRAAETVNQVGNDIVQKLSDPKFAATVGPAMGRVGTLRDFIGNPPPEFSELAGQIESYALANMGVHGMRSAQGAAQISKLLDAHHSPESLAATIRGLNDFSNRFVANNKPHAGGAQPAPAAGNKDPLGIR